ncbi:Dynein regulatory complex subunit 6 [Balamuthia mandrillaris]
MLGNYGSSSDGRLAFVAASHDPLLNPEQAEHSRREDLPQRQTRRALITEEEEEEEEEGDGRPRNASEEGAGVSLLREFTLSEFWDAEDQHQLQEKRGIDMSCSGTQKSSTPLTIGGKPKPKHYDSTQRLLAKIKGWKDELMESVRKIDKDLNEEAHERSRELSDGSAELLNQFKDQFLSTKEVCEVVLDPKYQGNCLGADMNKLACDTLLSRAPDAWKSAVIDSVPQNMEQVISLSNNMLEECFEEEEEDELSREPSADGVDPAMFAPSRGGESVQLHKFFEMYKSSRERMLRSRMESLKKKIEAHTSELVEDACKTALTSQVLSQANRISGNTQTYHKFVEGTLPQVPLEAAKNIRKRFSELVGQAMGEIDEMQSEVLNQKENYSNLVNKLRDMLIQEPQAKRYRASTLDDGCSSSSGGRSSDTAASPPDSSLSLGNHRRRSKGPAPSAVLRRASFAAPQLRRVCPVPKLAHLCVATCATYADYLPDIPEGCLPEELTQNLLDLLILQNRLNDEILQKLLNPCILSLSLKRWDALDISSCQLILSQCPRLRCLDLSHSNGLTDDCVRAIAKNASHLQSVNFSSCPKITDRSVCELLFRCSRNLREISFHKCHQLTDAAFQHISDCWKLSSVDLSKCPRITDKTLSGLGRCHQLRRLYMCGKGITDNGIFSLVVPLAYQQQQSTNQGAHTPTSSLFSSPPHLSSSPSSTVGVSPFVFSPPLASPNSLFSNTRFKLQNASRGLEHLSLINAEITDKSVHALIFYCPSLRHLDLTHCKHLTDSAFLLNDCFNSEDIQALFGSDENSLFAPRNTTSSSTTSSFVVPFGGRAHDNTSCSSPPTHFSPIGHRSLHKHRHCVSASPATTSTSTSSSCSPIGGETSYNGSAPAYRLYKLESLNLTHCLNIGNSTVRQIAKYSPNVHSLDLSTCEEITDSALLFLGNRCKNLRKLSLSRCRRVTDKALVQILKSTGQTLQSLSLQGCPLITQQTIMAIAEHCPNLLKLDLSWCKCITDEALVELVQGCPRLEVFMAEEASLSERGVMELCHLPRLRRLNLAYCSQLSDACLVALSRGCPALLKADFSYCNNAMITFEGLQEAISSWDLLSTLTLRGCNFITLHSIHHPNLKTLNLSWCKNLQDSALEGLPRGCPQLRSIDLAWCSKIGGTAVHQLARHAPNLHTFNLRKCSNIPSLTIKFLAKAGKTVYR